MLRGIKVRLYPTEEQEKQLKTTGDAARFAWNWMLGEKQREYKLGNNLSVAKARGRLISKVNEGEYPFLTGVSAAAWQSVSQDLNKGYTRFFNNLKKGIPLKDAGFPNWRYKYRFKPRFYLDARTLIVTRSDNKEKHTYGYVKLERIGYIKMRDEGRMPDGNYKKLGKPVSDVRIKYDGGNWYLVCTLEVEKEKPVLDENLKLGIDLGIKTLAFMSDGSKVVNINKSKEVKRLKRKQKRMQRELSRKYEANKEGKKYIKTKNILKLESELARVHKKIANIRLNHIHQSTNNIIKRKPSRIVLEDLNISGMMKNRYLADKIGEMNWYEFRRQMEYKVEHRLGDDVLVIASRWYASSKLCSNCGSKNASLNLKDRVYICGCGLLMDRDLNAAINLREYNGENVLFSD